MGAGGRLPSASNTVGPLALWLKQLYFPRLFSPGNLHGLWYLGFLVRIRRVVPQRYCPDLWAVSLTGETHLKLRAVISCQHAVKDNRVDSQLRPIRVVEVVASAWAERVFSRPDPQEPERGLPGPAGENPNGRS